MATTTPVKGIIFDVDGTLIDSNDAHAHAWVDALAEVGIAVPFERVRPLIGMGGDKLLPRAAGIEQGSAAGKRADERRGAIFRERYLPGIAPLPGVKALLAALRARGFDLIVASSAKRDELDPLLAITGAADVFTERLSGDDVTGSKPDRDLVSAALERLGLAPGEALMIGDTPYDIEAAAKAGVGTIAFRSGGFADDALAGARAIYDDPVDLLAHLDDSALGGGVPAGRPE